MPRLALFWLAGCAAGSVASHRPPDEDEDAGSGFSRGRDAGPTHDTSDAGPPPDTVDPLGPLVESVTARSTELAIEVHEGTIGFQLTGDDLYVETFTDPAGNRVYAGGVPRGWTADGPPSVAQVPMNEATTLPILAGTWSVSLASPTSGPIRLVSQRTSDGELHGGRLDLHLYVPAGGVRDEERGTTVTASTILDDYGAGIDDFFALLAALTGIDRGSVEVSEVDASFARVVGDEEEARAFGVSDGARGPGYHVLMTAGGYERGWSGLAPGAPAVQIAGDARSTALIDVRAHSYFGFVLMHELGHVTGLWHPSDVYADGGSVQYFHDPLADTAECTRTTSYEGETILGCTEESNLMASYGAASPVTLSPAQRAIFVRSAVYRPYAPATHRRAPARRTANVARPPSALFHCDHERAR
jgi:hypothetical protein